MSLQSSLQQTIPLTPESFDRFSSLIDPDWIDQALQTTGTASIRRRRLPAERVVWLVIGLALFRNEPIWHIVRQLGLSLDTASLLDWQQTGQQRHWLMRAKTGLRYEVVHTLGDGDWWVRLPVSPQARQARPDLPGHWEARLIECRHGGETRRYLTSLADAQRYRADLLGDHYRQRWEIEPGYREIKQGLLAGETTLRSKQPTLVRQEVWGVLIAYNLLREEMRQMAQALEVQPQRVGFQWAALAIVTLLRYCPLETPGTLPKRLALLREQARLYLLPPRRKRSYPRQVKPRAAKYPTKKCQSA